MARSVCHVATALDEGIRLDALCAEKGLYPSRAQAARAIESNKVLVNGRHAAKKQVVKRGDAIVCELLEETPRVQLQGEPIELDVRYEDDEVVVLSKQAGLICHPVNEHREGTLANALVYRYGAGGLCNVQGDNDRPGIVHRLDGDTSGLMLVAKTDESGSALMEQISLRKVDRRYLALLHGIVGPETGMIDVPIMRNPRDRTSMCAGDGPSSREAITTFAVLERFAGDGHGDGYTLVECKLYTGRTHQIRVHMQHVKHPVVGDLTYNSHGPKDAKAQLGLNRQFLHSYRIGFSHPKTGAWMEFRDYLPNDLAQALSSIALHSLGRTERGVEALESIMDGHRDSAPSERS